MKWIVREQQRSDSKYNAGSKARLDIDTIMVSEGYCPLIMNTNIDTSHSFLKKMVLQVSRFFEWEKCLEKTKKNDIVVIQYPVRNQTIFYGCNLKKLAKKGVIVYAFVHDLESFRLAIRENAPFTSKLKYHLEEISALNYFSKIVVHNEKMRREINRLFNIPFANMISIDVFDYLSDISKDTEEYNDKIIIAGSLDKRKAGYVYELPKEVDFVLYGANVDDKYTFDTNVEYKGKVDPDLLPSLLNGKFGLVWDGPTARTCAGVYGEYLKLNNPHKTSLYLSADIPVIVWSESAIADFVNQEQCGITINSLIDLRHELDKLKDEDYELLKTNAKRIGRLLRNGQFTKLAINKFFD